MAAVVFSIKPKFCNSIFSYQKQFEYRKTMLRRSNIDKMLIYCTSPVSMIIGEATLDYILCGSPADIWSQTKQHSGISKEFYDLYFKNSEKAIAYHLVNAVKYKESKSLVAVNLKKPPQSFCYL